MKILDRQWFLFALGQRNKIKNLISTCPISEEGLATPKIRKFCKQILDRAPGYSFLLSIGATISDGSSREDYDLFLDTWDSLLEEYDPAVESLGPAISGLNHLYNCLTLTGKLASLYSPTRVKTLDIRVHVSERDILLDALILHRWSRNCPEDANQRRASVRTMVAVCKTMEYIQPSTRAIVLAAQLHTPSGYQSLKRQQPVVLMGLEYEGDPLLLIFIFTDLRQCSTVVVYHAIVALENNTAFRLFLTALLFDIGKLRPGPSPNSTPNLLYIPSDVSNVPKRICAIVWRLVYCDTVWKGNNDLVQVITATLHSTDTSIEDQMLSDVMGSVSRWPFLLNAPDDGNSAKVVETEWRVPKLAECQVKAARAVYTSLTTHGRCLLIGVNGGGKKAVAAVAMSECNANAFRLHGCLPWNLLMTKQERTTCWVESLKKWTDSFEIVSWCSDLNMLDYIGRSTVFVVQYDQISQEDWIVIQSVAFETAVIDIDWISSIPLRNVSNLRVSGICLIAATESAIRLKTPSIKYIQDFQEINLDIHPSSCFRMVQGVVKIVVTRIVVPLDATQKARLDKWNGENTYSIALMQGFRTSSFALKFVRYSESQRKKEIDQLGFQSSVAMKWTDWEWCVEVQERIRQNPQLASTFKAYNGFKSPSGKIDKTLDIVGLQRVRGRVLVCFQIADCAATCHAEMKRRGYESQILTSELCQKVSAIEEKTEVIIAAKSTWRPYAGTVRLDNVRTVIIVESDLRDLETDKEAIAMAQHMGNTHGFVQVFHLVSEDAFDGAAPISTHCETS